MNAPVLGQRLVLGMIAVAGAGAAPADTIDTEAQAPYEQCGYCHEWDGNSRMPAYPRLAGQRAAYLIKQLRDFRAGHRAGPMQATAELLNDDELAVVAAYFQAQPAAAPGLAAQAEPAQHLARRLYLRGDPARGLAACSTCHGAEAMGAGTTPRLAGQHEAYLLTQLQQFAGGHRDNDVDAQMRRIAGRLANHERAALAAWLARLQAGAERRPAQGRLGVRTDGAGASNTTATNAVDIAGDGAQASPNTTASPNITVAPPAGPRRH